MIQLLILLVSSVFINPSAFALQKEDLRKKIYESFGACDEATYSDENYLALSLPGQEGVRNFVRVTMIESPEKSFTLPLKDRVVDIKIREGILYVLTPKNLLAWNMQTEKLLFNYATYPHLTNPSNVRQMATGFILSGNQAIISHGALGVTVLDLNAGMFVKLLRMPTISSAQDIGLVHPTLAILTVDNEAESQFRGLYLMDLNSLEFVKQIKVDNAFPLAVRVPDKNRLLLSYMNAVWKFDLESTLQSIEAKPERRAWKLPGLTTVNIIGKMSVDKKYLYACFAIPAEGKQGKKIIPLAIDLDAIQLN